MDLTVQSKAELVEAIRSARATSARIELLGGSSKASMGPPRGPGVTRICLERFDSLIDYDPAELVVTVGAGMRIDHLNALLAAEGQTLAFEPFDFAPICGTEPGRSTVGGVIGAGVAGPRRLSRGGARDHLLGFQAVGGTGELIIGGAKVVKNVTGYDLPKLMTGSWGRLAAFTELSLRVIPAPRVLRTLVLDGASPQTASLAIIAALGSPAEVAAAAYLPICGRHPSRLALRLEGFEPSVADRTAQLQLLLPDARLEVADAETAKAFWDTVRDVRPLRQQQVLWRISAPLKQAPNLCEALSRNDCQWIWDWGGSLIWAAAEELDCRVRDIVDSFGGQASLVRASEPRRQDTPMLQPRPPALAALERRVCAAFDPDGVFDIARFGDASFAH